MSSHLDLRRIANALNGEVAGGGVRAPGPGHSTKDRSLTITLSSDAPDGFVVHSFAGDDPIVCKDYVREKCGLPQFQPNGNGRSNGTSNNRRRDQDIESFVMAAINGQRQEQAAHGSHVATFAYTDDKGELLYEVLKYENPKTFRQRRPDGKGGWIWKLDEQRVLYRWPELLKYPDATIFCARAKRTPTVLLCSGTAQRPLRAGNGPRIASRRSPAGTL